MVIILVLPPMCESFGQVHSILEDVVQSPELLKCNLVILQEATDVMDVDDASLKDNIIGLHSLDRLVVCYT